MEYWRAFWFGLSQGLTEIFPVSNVAHQELVRELVDNRDAEFQAFFGFILLGSLLALLIFYRKKVIQIFKDAFKNRAVKMLTNIFISSAIAIVAGVLLVDPIKYSFFMSWYSIAIFLGLIGVAMVLIDKLPHLKKIKDETKMDQKRALGVGISQVAALIPGVGRISAGLVSGRMLGMSDKSSADYAFLISIPILAGMIIREFCVESSRMYFAENIGTTIYAIAVVLIAGLCTLHIFSIFIKKKDAIKKFGYYRIILAIVLIIFELLK